jgi:hypothetical protein
MDSKKSLSDLYHYDLASYWMQMEGIMLLMESECLRLSPGGRPTQVMEDLKRMLEVCRENGKRARKEFEEQLHNELGHLQK